MTHHRPRAGWAAPLGALCVLTFVLLLAGAPRLAPAHAQIVDRGVNWFGQFYGTTDLTGPVIASQSYPSGLDFRWTENAPPVPPGVNNQSFSAVFTSTQVFGADGTWRFIVGSDDGVRLFVDGILVLDRFVPREFVEEPVDVFLVAGTHQLRVEYFQAGVDAILRVGWFLFSPLQPGQPLPGQPLFPSQPTLVLPPTATPGPVEPYGRIANVRGLSIRSGPYLGASRVGIAQPEVFYSITARNLDEGTFPWYEITTPRGTVGWASGRYLLVTGNLDAIPVRATRFETVAGLPDVGVGFTTRSNLRLRRRPSTRTEILGVLDWGAQGAILARTVQANQNFWYYVRTNDGREGWVSAAFVTVRGDLAAVPVY